MNKASVLGVTFQVQTLSSVLLQIKQSVDDKKFLRIVTVNPEFLVRAQKHERFLVSLQKAQVSLVDGFGLWAVLRLQGFKTQRITGADLISELLSSAEQKEWQVAFVLSSFGLTRKDLLQNILTKKYPHLKTEIFTEKEEFQNSNADIFLIALGEPEQEYVGENIKKGVVIGVGGAVDFLTGQQRRAPKCIQKYGLEWIWRLIQQPQRFGRIWNAVIIFPLFVLKQRKFL